MFKKSRLLLFSLILLTVSLVMSGCQNPSTQAITFFNYGENIDQQTLDDFKTQTGITVNVETFDDMETMYLKLTKSSAAYDVVLVSDLLMPRMIEAGYLLELDKSQVPNLAQMDTTYLNLNIDPQNSYSVPYMFGTVGLVYDKSRVGEAIDSWSVLFDPKFQKRVFMFDTYRDTLGVALKTLGYSLNTDDPKALEAAKELLLKQKEAVQPIYGVDNGTELLPAGETDINMIWSGEGLNLQEENPNLTYVIPKEGANFWIDSLCISAKSKNSVAAHRFINFVSDKENALRIADEIGYTTPNREARAMQPESVRNNPNAYMTPEMMARCEIYIDLKSEVKDAYYKAWTQIKGQ